MGNVASRPDQRSDDLQRSEQRSRASRRTAGGEHVRAYPDLFTAAAFSDQDTSREAAKAIVPHKSRLQAVVLDALRKYGGLTACELEGATGLDGNTIRPRLCELRDKGLVEDSGERRKTTSGRNAVVWRIRQEADR